MSTPTGLKSCCYLSKPENTATVRSYKKKINFQATERQPSADDGTWH